MKISAALIMKNEEKNLPRLLESIKGKFYEIVVIDTGSTDKSIEIAKKYGCKVYEKDWEGFADARNFAIKKCSGDWIWHFDADFELEDKEFEKFKKYINLVDKKRDINVLTLYVKNFSKDGNIKSVSTQAFIHRNIKDIFWIGNIHERLNVKESFGTDIFINHFGYEDINIQKDKAYRNLELIKKDLNILKKDSKEYFLKLFYLFQTYTILSFFEKKYIKEALEFVDEFLNLSKKYESNESKFFTTYIFVYISELLIKKDDLKSALNFIEKGLEKIENFPDLLYMKAKIYKNMNKDELAKENYIKFLESVDSFEKSPIKNSYGFAIVIDSIGNIPYILEKVLPNLIKKNEIEEIKRLWKNSKNRYIAYLLAKLYEKYEKEKFEKFLIKISKIYNYYLIDNLLATKYLNNKDYNNAIKFAKKTLAYNSYDAHANEILAISLYHLGNYKESILYFRKALSNIKNKDTFLLIIDALKKAGFYKEAEILEKKYKNY